MESSSIFNKYNIPVPRYTSYPTVPLWDLDSFEATKWPVIVKRDIKNELHTPFSLYTHLPYCESLCTFCGCFKRITKQHDVEKVYIEALIREWQLYKRLIHETEINEWHLGGGTPTFFSPKSLNVLVDSIMKNQRLSQNAVFSLEANPAYTTEEHLRLLAEKGFSRISFGVQDYSPAVQDAINRIHRSSEVATMVDNARKHGFKSINIDLVYGLPYQTLDSISLNISEILKLRPNRIAYYGYAHVPWIKGLGQRKFSEKDIPGGAEKRSLYEHAKAKLLDAGYREIGMDHFALPEDPLYQAKLDKELHRNFMGYTPNVSTKLIGLGVSSISEMPGAYAQNTKSFEEYFAKTEAGEFPIVKGHIMTLNDQYDKRIIQNIMCNAQANLNWTLFSEEEKSNLQSKLRELCEDGLVILKDNQLEATESGYKFLRNIASVFDRRQTNSAPNQRLFSLSV